jgi:hypothetical protein
MHSSIITLSLLIVFYCFLPSSLTNCRRNPLGRDILAILSPVALGICVRVFCVDLRNSAVQLQLTAVFAAPYEVYLQM